MPKSRKCPRIGLPRNVTWSNWKPGYCWNLLWLYKLWHSYTNKLSISYHQSISYAENEYGNSTVGFDLLHYEDTVCLDSKHHFQIWTCNVNSGCCASTVWYSQLNALCYIFVQVNNEFSHIENHFPYKHSADGSKRVQVPSMLSQQVKYPFIARISHV